MTCVDVLPAFITKTKNQKKGTLWFLNWLNKPIFRYPFNVSSRNQKLAQTLVCGINVMSWIICSSPCPHFLKLPNKRNQLKFISLPSFFCTKHTLKGSCGSPDHWDPRCTQADKHPWNPATKQLAARQSSNNCSIWLLGCLWMLTPFVYQLSHSDSSFRRLSTTIYTT